MAVNNYFRITLDTVAPSGVTIKLNSGATTTASQLVTVSFTVTDPSDITQMKIWGDVDAAYSTFVAATEEAAGWQTFVTSTTVKLAVGAGLKHIYAKVRDNVGNESDQITAAITLSLIPEVAIANITAPANNGTEGTYKISTVKGFDVATVIFTVDKAITEHKVMYVTSVGADVTSGTLIPTTGGSENTSATYDTPKEKDSQITVKINGTDLKAVTQADGDFYIKLFAKDEDGNWSA